jgi:hypothetical protein
MVTLLDPPLLGEEVKSGLPVLIFAMDVAGSSCVFVTFGTEGEIRMQDVSEVRSDFRYDYDKREWYDKSSQGHED